MESVITASGLSAHWDGSPETTSGISDPPLEDPGKITDRLSTLLISEEGRSRYLGASSGFSLFSPQGLQWISEKTGSNELAKFISSISSNLQSYMPKNSSAELYRPLYPSEREPLPPKVVADHYVQYYFNSYNSIFPLFDRGVFDKSYDLQYSGNPPSGPAWYACLNIVLCIGCLLFRVRPQGEPNNSPGELDWKKYFRNASSCFTDLLFEDGSLQAIQAIVGMAVVQQISLQPQAVYILTAAAGRLVHGIGLHRNFNDLGLSQVEIKQRNNVFWIVYFLDKSIALRLGHPSVLNDDDIGIDLPVDEIVQKRPDGSTKYSIFRCQAQLARLESRIHTELYSARALRKSAMDRLRMVGELDKALMEWKEALPLEIQPERAIECEEDYILPIVMMHFAYFNCLTTIHRVSIHHGSWTSTHLSESGATLHDQHLNPRVYASQSICLAAARQSIQLLRFVDIKAHSTANSVIWVLLYYPLSGLLTLFAATIQNPQNPQVTADLDLMEVVISYFSEPIIHVNDITATTARIFEELVKVAKKYVEKTGFKASKPTKRSHDESDSEQDISQQAPEYLRSAESFSGSNINFDTTSPVLSSIEPSYQNLPATSFDVPTTGGMMPQDINVPQYPLQSSSFPAQDFSMSTSQVSDDIMRHPDAASIIPVVSEYFEWDLANLWSFDFTQGHQ